MGLSAIHHFVAKQVDEIGHLEEWRPTRCEGGQHKQCATGSSFLGCLVRHVPENHHLASKQAGGRYPQFEVEGWGWRSAYSHVEGVGHRMLGDQCSSRLMVVGQVM